MPRPKKEPADPDRKPRSLKEIFKLLEGAEHLYLQTGGNDIDVALQALRHTMNAYDSQMSQTQAQAEVGVEFDERRTTRWGPNVTTHEARLTASRISILVKQREEKMAKCQALVEEGFAARDAEAEAERDASASVPEAEPSNENNQPANATNANVSGADATAAGGGTPSEPVSAGASSGEFHGAGKQQRRMARRNERKHSAGGDAAETGSS